MRILVTGGAGFIGSHIIDALHGRGHDVRVLDLRDGDDVRDAGTVRRAMDGVDAVCHQAAIVGLGADLVRDLPAYTSVNVLGTAVLLAEMARRGVRRLVLASSMVVYGEGGYACPAHGAVRPLPRAAADLAAGRFELRCPRCGAVLVTEPVTEDVPLDPRNVYAATKVAQEHLAASWARASGGTAAALRYHNVYGPRMPRDTPYAGVASIFAAALRRGEPPRVFEDGRQLRDFVHVRDVATANVVALETPGRPGEPRAYNVASGEPHTVGELAAALAEVHGGPAPVVTGEYRLGDVRHVVASADRIARELGHRATIQFAAGIRAQAGSFT